MLTRSTNDDSCLLDVMARFCFIPRVMQIYHAEGFPLGFRGVDKAVGASLVSRGRHKRECEVSLVQFTTTLAYNFGFV